MIVISIAGSSTIREYIVDAAFIQIPYIVTPSATPSTRCLGCWVDAGFYAAWLELRRSVLAAISTAIAAYPKYTLVITGHSLGGAVATMAAAELRSRGHKADLYSYGSPRCGNEAFAKFVMNQQVLGLGANYRITHATDPITRVPPTWLGYQHTSPEYWIMPDTLSGKNEHLVNDIKICRGLGNDDCSTGSGRWTLDVEAHLDYFGAIAGCSTGKLIWRSEGQAS